MAPWNGPNNCKQAELVTTFKRKLKSSHRTAPLIRYRRTVLYKFATELNGIDKT